MDYCFFGHTYGKWEITEEGEIMRRDLSFNVEVEGSKRVVGKYLYQKRICKICGYTDLNVQKIYTS